MDKLGPLHLGTVYNSDYNNITNRIQRVHVHLTLHYWQHNHEMLGFMNIHIQQTALQLPLTLLQSSIYGGRGEPLEQCEPQSNISQKMVVSGVQTTVLSQWVT